MNSAGPALSSTVASPIWIRGASSSSVIVPTPKLPRIVAALAFERSSVKVSSIPSSSASPVTVTVTVWDVTPGSNVSVPEAASKSVPATAVTFVVV